jgi:hypothetical protein
MTGDERILEALKLITDTARMARENPKETDTGMCFGIIESLARFVYEELRTDR